MFLQIEAHDNLGFCPRYMGLKWLVFLAGPPYLINMWFSEDQRANIIKTQLKEIGLYPQISIVIVYSILNTIGRM
jgi:hypothetical protein